MINAIALTNLASVQIQHCFTRETSVRVKGSFVSRPRECVCYFYCYKDKKRANYTRIDVIKYDQHVASLGKFLCLFSRSVWDL